MGYFPFQIRGNTIQALGSPLVDYQSIICDSDFCLDLKDLLEVVQKKRFEFNGWLGTGVGRKNHLVAHSYFADLNDGFDCYMSERKSNSPSFFKSLKRRTRSLYQDFGSAECEVRKATKDDVMSILNQKQLQYLQKGTFDVFDCGWTVSMLLALTEASDDDFGLFYAELCVGDKKIAGELFLREGDFAHSWFPVFNSKYSKYSPGHLLTLMLIEKLTSLGVKNFDFGVGHEKYKESLASRGNECLEGAYSANEPAAHAFFELVDKLAPKIAKVMSRYRHSVYRRRRILTACEPTLIGKVSAGIKMAKKFAARRFTNLLIFINCAYSEISTYTLYPLAIA
jgi:CelD/BcsL family acetyltransferase involved in cellulose biosynthesis